MHDHRNCVNEFGTTGECVLFSVGAHKESLVLGMLTEESRYVMSSVPCNIHWIFLFHLLSGMFDTPSYQAKYRVK